MKFKVFTSGIVTIGAGYEGLGRWGARGPHFVGLGGNGEKKFKI